MHYLKYGPPQVNHNPVLRGKVFWNDTVALERQTIKVSTRFYGKHEIVYNLLNMYEKNLILMGLAKTLLLF